MLVRPFDGVAQQMMPVVGHSPVFEPDYREID
jgi:hypothetical protein